MQQTYRLSIGVARADRSLAVAKLIHAARVLPVANQTDVLEPHSLRERRGESVGWCHFRAGGIVGSDQYRLSAGMRDRKLAGIYVERGIGGYLDSCPSLAS